MQYKELNIIINTYITAIRQKLMMRRSSEYQLLTCHIVILPVFVNMQELLQATLLEISDFSLVPKVFR